MTLNHYLTILSSHCDRAWRDHVISNNPCTLLVYPEATSSKIAHLPPFCTKSKPLKEDRGFIDWLVLTIVHAGFVISLRRFDAQLQLLPQHNRLSGSPNLILKFNARESRPIQAPPFHDTCLLNDQFM